MSKIRVLMNGATGKMGKAISAGIACEPDMQMVGAVDLKLPGVDLGTLCGTAAWNVLVEPDLAGAIERIKPDVVVDFTNPQAVMKNIEIVTAHRVPMVVGTTGLTAEDLKKVQQWCVEKNTKVFVAANFALGAVLMMGFAKEAAKYFPNVEIIEMHHDQKLDAPSGTAAATMEMISEVREVFAQGATNEIEKINGARGGDYQGMRVHSVRLPGYVASQEVLFGGVGQVLSIRHDALNRDSFVPGVVLAVRKIQDLDGLVCGLDKIM